MKEKYKKIYKKIASEQQKGIPSVQFDLEEDAEEIFLKHIESESFAPKKESDESESSLKRAKSASSDEKASIDLHGQTVEEALGTLERKISGLLHSRASPFSLRIITGKGRNSPGSKGVLIEACYTFVAQRYATHIVRIDEAPAKLVLGNLPIKGYFDVTLKPY